MSQLASTPAPTYFAVIFTSLRSPADPEGYEATANRMVELACQQPGYLGVESARGSDGLGITVSYWSDLNSIRAWREHAEHALAQEQGRAKWYTHYSLRIARVERAWDFACGAGVSPAAGTSSYRDAGDSPALLKGAADDETST